MKRKLGANTYLYPMPTTIIGANVNGKPNFNAIAYIGVVCHQPPMVAFGMNKNHLTMQGIKENMTLSVNLPDTKMLQVTDYVGMKSGKAVDKTKLFDLFYGELKTAPMINECPLSLECSVKDILDYGGVNYTVTAEIVQAHVSEHILSEKGLPDIKKLDPVIFSMHENLYYNLGSLIGKAWQEGAKYTK